MPPRIQERPTAAPVTTPAYQQQETPIQKARRIQAAKRKQSKPWKSPVGGPPEKVTEELCKSVAALVLQGLSTKHALAQVAPKLTPAQFQHALRTRRLLEWAYDKAIGTGLLKLLQQIPGTTRATLPVGTCWLLERVHNYVPSSKSNVQVEHRHSLAGFDAVVVQRAAQLARMRHAPPEVRALLTNQGPTGIPSQLGRRSRERAHADTAAQLEHAHAQQSEQSSRTENMPSPTPSGGGYQIDTTELQKSEVIEVQEVPIP